MVDTLTGVLPGSGDAVTVNFTARALPIADVAPTVKPVRLAGRLARARGRHGADERTVPYGTGTLHGADTANFTNSIFNHFINSVDVGDSMQLRTLTFVDASHSSSTQRVTLTTGTGTTCTLSAFRNPTSQTFSPSTAAGPVAIGTLSAGDLAAAIGQGARMPWPIRRIGTRLVDPAGVDDDMTRMPMPSGSVPMRDLPVTADHCDFEADGPVPARLPVDDARIARETNRAPFRVCRSEFKTNLIPILESLTREDHLATGARRGARDRPVVRAPHPAHDGRTAARRRLGVPACRATPWDPTARHEPRTDGWTVTDGINRRRGRRTAGPMDKAACTRRCWRSSGPAPSPVPHPRTGRGQAGPIRLDARSIRRQFPLARRPDGRCCNIRVASAALVFVVEESPGSTRERCRLTTGGGDPRESATENRPPTRGPGQPGAPAGKGETVR